MLKWFLLIFCLIPGCLTLASNDLTTGWRSDGSGKYPQSTPPLQWSEEHFVWKTKMPDWSNAQAIIVGDRIFANSEPNTLICLNTADGTVLWQHGNEYSDALGAEEVAKIKASAEVTAAPLRAKIEALNKQVHDLREKQDNSLRGQIRGLYDEIQDLKKQLNKADPLNLPDKHKATGFSSAVPLSDGKHIFAVYGNGVVSCFDLEGQRLWSRLVEKPAHRWGHSASPVLSGDILVVHIQGVKGLDRKTGATLWETDAEPGFGSPLLTQIGTEPVVITAAKADVIRVSDGVKLHSEIAGLKFATPIEEGGVLYFMENNASAYKKPASLEEGMVFEKLWEARIKGSRHYASSLLHGDLIYAVSREGWLSALDRNDGTLVYEHKLDIPQNSNSAYPSLTLGGNHLFLGFEEGVVLVLEPGRSYKEVARNQLERFRGSPVFKDKDIFIRGMDFFYRIGAQ